MTDHVDQGLDAAGAAKEPPASNPDAHAGHYQTKEEDRVDFLQMLAYGLGAFVNNLLSAAVGSMTIVLNLGLGMSPSLMGWLGAIPRFTDALTDPLMGYISDNTRTRWGRRRPYIFVGAIASGIAFALLWQIPESWSEGAQFTYFLAVSLVFYLAFTCFATPWVALGYELTPDYHERTRLMGVQNFVGQIPYIIAPWFLAFMTNDYWAGDMVQGARMLAIVVAAVAIVVGILPAIFLRERFVSPEPSSEATKAAEDKAEKPSLVDTMKDFFSGFTTTISRYPFALLCAVTFLVFNGFILIAAFQSYVIIYYVFGGNKEAGSEYVGLSGSIGAISSFVVIALVTAMSTRLGKRRAFFSAIAISMLGYGLKWFCYNPDYPILLVLPAPLMAFGLGGLFTLVPAMVADVVDVDELETHQRREGMYGSVFWWMVKMGMSAALALSGYLLEATGFDANLDGPQAAETVFLLRVFDVLVPVITSGLAIFVIYIYPITEQRAHEVRAELEARRGSLA